MSFRRSVIIAEFWRPELARIGTFWRNLCVFWKNDPLCKNFQNSVWKVYIATPIDIVVCKIREHCPTGNRWNRALLRWPKKISAPSQTVATARIAPKVSRGQPPTSGSQCSKFHPIRFTFGGVIAGRVKAVKTRLKVFPILCQAIASRWVIILFSTEHWAMTNLFILIRQMAEAFVRL